MELIEKNADLSVEEKNFFLHSAYVSIDTETGGLNYLRDKLCTIQLFSEGYGVIIRFNCDIDYSNLKEILLSQKTTKIFHNAVFDVSFLMKNLEMEDFSSIVCTKISSKLINGIDHDNSLKFLLRKYLNIYIDKAEQLSDWSKDVLSESQKKYILNDIQYLPLLWEKLHEELIHKGLEELAFKCFDFIPYYKKITSMGIENIFTY